LGTRGLGGHLNIQRGRFREMTTITLDDYKDNEMETSPSPTLLASTITMQIYFDGLCQPCNPGGTACFAFIVKNEEGNTIHSEYGLAKHNSTNNVSEYTGIINDTMM
jgi:hypothetical protein